MNLFNVILFIIYNVVLSAANSTNQCGEVFTDTIGFISAQFLDYSATCKWTIIARHNELVITKISTINTPPLRDVLRVSHSVGSLTSTESVNATHATLWIKGGKIVLMINYDFDFCNYKICNVENYQINVTYEIVPLKANDCEETIWVRNSQVIRFPYKSVSSWEGNSVGCNVLLRAENQSLKAELVVDLPDRRSVALTVSDARFGRTLLPSNEYWSPFQKTLNPKQNSLYVRYRFRQPVIFADKVRLELTVVNSGLDCEFKNTTCEWTTAVGRWTVVNVIIESLAGTALSLGKSGIVGNYSQLDSPFIRTGDQQLCAKMSYWLKGCPGNVLYILLVGMNKTINLWTSEYGNGDKVFREAQFIIPKHSEGIVRLLQVEGKATNDELLEINHVRSWWNRCEEKSAQESHFLEFEQDLSGTEVFYRDDELYRANLPLLGSVARLRSKVVRTFRDSCIQLDYEGSSQLSVLVAVNDSMVERLSLSFGFGPRSSQFSLSKNNNIQVILEASNLQNGESRLIIKGVHVQPGRCRIDCDFKTGTCSWWTENLRSTSVIDGHMTMLHDPWMNNLTRNEITSALTWESNSWFCLKFRIGSIPALCIQVGINVFDSVGLKIGEEVLMTQCGDTLDYTTQCVHLSRQRRPLKVFTRTTSKGHLSDENVIENVAENVNIASVWTTSECEEHKMNCGWSQPSNSTVDASVFWNVINKETGPVLRAQRSCCSEETREEAVVWSPSFFAKNVSWDSKISKCLSFSYSAQLRHQKYRSCSRNNSQYLMNLEETGKEVCGHPLTSSNQNVSTIKVLLDNSTNLIWEKVLPKKAKGETYVVSLSLLLDSNKEHRIGFSAVLSKMSLEVGDLTMTEGECAATNHNCRFDTGLCDWSKEGEDFYSWTWTDSSDYLRNNTGPLTDCSLTRGGFVFADSGLEGQVAHLVSPDLPINIGCVSFCYHMRGVGVGQLEVRLIGKEGGNETLLWSKGGNQGFPWHYVRIPIESGNSNFLKFTGRKGGALGDIAVDSIVFSENTHCEKMDEIVNVPLIF